MAVALNHQALATQLQESSTGRAPGIKEIQTPLGSLVYIGTKGLSAREKHLYMQQLDTPASQVRCHLCVYCGCISSDILRHLSSKVQVCSMRWMQDPARRREICAIATAKRASAVDTPKAHLVNVHADLRNAHSQTLEALSGIKRKQDEISNGMVGQCHLCQEPASVHCQFDHYICNVCFGATMSSGLDNVIKDPLHCQHDGCEHVPADPDQPLPVPADAKLQRLSRQLLEKQVLASIAKQVQDTAIAAAATSELDRSITSASNLLNHTSQCCDRVLELADGCAKVSCPGCSRPVCIACFFMSTDPNPMRERSTVYAHIQDTHRAGCRGTPPTSLRSSH